MIRCKALLREEVLGQVLVSLVVTEIALDPICILPHVEDQLQSEGKEEEG
jgi:hypothetical protein